MSPLFLMMCVAVTMAAMVCAAWYRARAPALVFARTRPATASSGRGAKNGVTALQACPEPLCLPLGGPLPAPPWGLEASGRGRGLWQLPKGLPGLAKPNRELATRRVVSRTLRDQPGDEPSYDDTPSGRSRRAVYRSARQMCREAGSRDSAFSALVEIKGDLPQDLAREAERAFRDVYDRGAHKGAN